MAWRWFLVTSITVKLIWAFQPVMVMQTAEWSFKAKMERKEEGSGKWSGYSQHVNVGVGVLAILNSTKWLYVGWKVTLENYLCLLSRLGFWKKTAWQSINCKQDVLSHFQMAGICFREPWKNKGLFWKASWKDTWPLPSTIWFPI